MRECRNFFEVKQSDVTEHEGSYSIAEGSLSPVPDEILTGQYIAIYGSVLNDGIWKVGTDGALTGDYDAVDEGFTATIYPLKVPPDFVQLATDITAWKAKMDESSPYASETFPHYSYTKAQKQGGGNITWQQQFTGRIQPFRRMFKGLPL
jgi:hypothetical protein